MNDVCRKLFLRTVLILGAVSMTWMSPDLLHAKEQTPWKAPSRASKKTNPVPYNDASIAAGKILYTQHCVSCHGNDGKGGGPAAADLEVKPKDHTDQKMKEESDGALYWKVKVGRTPMPAFRGILKPEQIWKTVNYMRNFTGGKTQATAEKVEKKEGISKRKTPEGKTPNSK